MFPVSNQPADKPLDFIDRPALGKRKPKTLGLVLECRLRGAEASALGFQFDEGASAISNEAGSESVLHITSDGSLTVSEGGGIVICTPRKAGSRAAGFPDGALLLFVVFALVLKKRGRVPFER